MDHQQVNDLGAHLRVLSQFPLESFPFAGTVPSGGCCFHSCSVLSFLSSLPVNNVCFLPFVSVSLAHKRCGSLHQHPCSSSAPLKLQATLGGMVHLRPTRRRLAPQGPGQTESQQKPHPTCQLKASPSQLLICKFNKISIMNFSCEKDSVTTNLGFSEDTSVKTLLA